MVFPPPSKDGLKPVVFEVPEPPCGTLQVEAEDPAVLPPEPMDLNAMLEWVIECEEAALASKKNLTSSPELVIQNSTNPSSLMVQRSRASSTPMASYSKTPFTFNPNPLEFRHQMNMARTVYHFVQDPRLSIIAAEHSYSKPQPLHKDLPGDLILTTSSDDSENEIEVVSDIDYEYVLQEPSSGSHAVLSTNSSPLGATGPSPPLDYTPLTLNNARQRIERYEGKRKRRMSFAKLSDELEEKASETCSKVSRKSTFDKGGIF